ncbi:abcF4 [Symbiodinium sp. CCMP2592]|nr:abcF4 [Symbiodinium sp. CCMP2592]
MPKREQRLDQEPSSQTPAQRADLERLRAYELHDRRPWPTLPANDAPEALTDPILQQEHMDLDPAQDFTFAILTTGYKVETVTLTLSAPVDVADALALLNDERDQVHARLFPRLLDVRPMPSPHFGLVLATPAWSDADVCLCIDLQEIDGRLYADLGPAHATRATLLQFVGFRAEDPIDVYVGASPDPLPPHEQAELHQGMCLFFTPQHALPGAYYHLADILLSADSWHDHPYVPRGPDSPCMCVVTDKGHQFFCFDNEEAYGSLQVLSRAFSIPMEHITVQPAVPSVHDAAIQGRPCRSVCAVSGLIFGREESDGTNPCTPILGIVDCRAMHQGWDLLAEPDGKRPYAEFRSVLETFAPPSWELHIEWPTLEDGILCFQPGTLLYASYVLQRRALPLEADTEHADTETSEVVSSDEDAAMEPPETDRQLTPDSADLSATSSSTSRSRPSRRGGPAGGPAGPPPPIPVNSPGRGVGGPTFTAVFLLLTPEYTPERVSVQLPEQSHFAVALDRIQQARAATRRGYHPRLEPVVDQPLAGCILLLALPAWTTDLYVAFNCAQVNGSVFCVHVPHRTDRTTLLAHAGFASTEQLDVYVPGLLGPLQPHEVITLQIGSCVSLLPQGAGILIVSSSQDRLQDPNGWEPHALPPVVAGAWLHVMTDEGSHRLHMPAEGRRFLRQELGHHLGLPATYHLQPARPPLEDSCDRGIPADNVYIASADARLEHPTTNGEAVMFILDARPILCGITWGFAHEGIVNERAVLDKCNLHRPEGYQACLIGGRRDLFGQLRVGAGEAITVFFAITFRTDVGDNYDEEYALRRPGTTPGNQPHQRGLQPPTPGGTATDAPLPADIQPEGRPRQHGQHHVQRHHHPHRDVLHKDRPAGLAIFLSWLIGAVLVQPGTAMQMHHETQVHLSLPPGLPHGSSQDCLSQTQAFCRAECSPQSVQTEGAHTLHIGRPLPTPCRALPMQPRADMERPEPDAVANAAEQVGPTLLEEACHQTSPSPMWVAATLLETLQEHFQPPADEQDATTPTCKAETKPAPLPLSLADAVPASPFQQEVQQLQQILPQPPAHRGTAVALRQSDWLDNDLSMPLAQSDIPTDLRDKIARMPRWHTHPLAEQVTKLLVYTDGSATPDKEKPGADIRPAAWAFAVWAVIGDLHLFVGYSAQPTMHTDSPFYVGEHSDTPLEAELLALVWALVWTWDSGLTFGLDIEIRYDCTAAGAGTFAAAKQVRHPSVDGHMELPAFAGALRQAVETHVPIVHTHVKGHSGELGNELCDILSRWARNLCREWQQICLPSWPACLRQHRLCPWCWMAVSSKHDLPALEALETEANRLQRLPQDALPPTACHKGGPIRTAHVKFRFTAMTFNVLTMFDPTAPHGKDARTQNLGFLITGKKCLIKQQLSAHAVLLAGFQETRLPTTGVLPDEDFLILSAEADHRGHGGCALWINLRVPLATAAGTSHHVRRNQVTVTATSPRHLQALIETPHINLVVLVLHAPRIAQAGEAEVRAFWQQRAADLLARPTCAEYLVLMDANAHLGTITTEAVADHGAEEENAEGEFCHDFLLAIQGLLPSTLSHVHGGQHWTWTTAPPAATKHRIDYVVTPQNWEPFLQASWVWHTFEALHTRQDHLPVCLTVAFEHNVPSYYEPRRAQATCRPSLARTPEDALARRTALTTMPEVPWNTAVDTHSDIWTQAMRRVATAFHPQHTRPPTQSYLQPDTVALVHRRTALREYLRQEEAELNRRHLLISFAALVHATRGVPLTPHAQQVAATWMQQIDYSIAWALQLLKEHTTAIRAAIRRDRCSYLEGLRANITVQDLRQPKHLYRAVRAAFPAARSARRKSFMPLPAVRMEDGQLAPTGQARQERWTAFFAEQESGRIVTPLEYTQAFKCPDIPVDTRGVCFDVLAVPTLHDLEQQILGLRLGKAPGPDGLTAEALRLHAASTARALYPLCLKTSIGLREPVDWRGGCLITLAKRAAAALECTAFRSILLANVTAKLQHRLLRNKLLPPFGDYKPEAQAGQLPGMGVDAVGLTVRAYQVWARHRKQPAAVAFFDLKSAFYRIIRQTLVPTAQEPDDAAFLALIRDLGVPPDAVQELVQHLNSMAVLSEAEVSPHLIQQTADLFRGSWFKLQGDSPLVLTRRGTRPGDPAADLLFAYSFAACCKAIDQALADKGLATAIPLVTAQPPWHTWEVPSTAGLPAWADDFTFLQSRPTSPQLCRDTVAAMELIAGITASTGMLLSYGEDKTAVLLSSDCNRDQTMVSHDAQGKPGFSIRNPVTRQEHWAPIVDSYKHLGTIAVAGATPDVEIRYRHAQGLSTLKPLRRKLFSDSGVPIEVRRTLLRALVMAKFVFSSAILHLTAQSHRRTWARCYLLLWRGLLRWTRADNSPHSLHVLYAAQAPSPPLALAQARAVFFARALAQGPSILLHFLHVQWRETPATSWLHQFTHDIQAVAMYVPAAQLLVQAACPVTALCEVLQDEPNWWKAQIRKAITAYQRELELWVQKPAAPPTSRQEPTANVHAFRCPHCPATFPLRKHLGVHLARKHGYVSPVRHYVAGPYCGACMRWYHTTARVHNHLKHAKACMMRLLHVMPPLTMAEIKEVEAADRAIGAKIKRGHWQSYRATLPPVPWYGPRAPTYSEATAGLEEGDLDLHRIAQLYRPHPRDVDWMSSYCGEVTVEGPRKQATDFWLTRPSALPGHDTATTVSPVSVQFANFGHDESRYVPLRVQIARLIEVKKFTALMSLEQSASLLHMDCWGMKKLFSTAIRRWGVQLGNRKDPGVDSFYGVVSMHWGKLLPDINKGPRMQLIDLTTEAGKSNKVKREIPDVIKIEDDDEENLEQDEYQKLEGDTEAISYEELQQRIDYLKACCDDGYGVIILDEEGQDGDVSTLDTQVVDAEQLDAAAHAEMEDEEIPVVSRVGQFAQREARKRKKKGAEITQEGPTEHLEPAPATPPTKTSPLKLTTKLDHDSAKRLLRSEKVIGFPDATQRYLLDELEKEAKTTPRSMSPTDSEKEREVLEDTVRQARRASWPEDYADVEEDQKQKPKASKSNVKVKDARSSASSRRVLASARSACEEEEEEDGPQSSGKKRPGHQEEEEEDPVEVPRKGGSKKKAKIQEEEEAQDEGDWPETPKSGVKKIPEATAGKKRSKAEEDEQENEPREPKKKAKATEEEEEEEEEDWPELPKKGGKRASAASKKEAKADEEEEEEEEAKADEEEEEEEAWPEPPKKGGKNASAASKKKAKANEEEEEEEEGGKRASAASKKKAKADEEEEEEEEDAPELPKKGGKKASAASKKKAKADEEEEEEEAWPEPPKKGGKNASAASKKKAKANEEEEEEEEDWPELPKKGGKRASAASKKEAKADEEEEEEEEDAPELPKKGGKKASAASKKKAKADEEEEEEEAWPEPPKKGGKNASAASKKKAKANEEEEEEEEDWPELPKKGGKRASAASKKEAKADEEEEEKEEDGPEPPKKGGKKANAASKKKAKATEEEEEEEEEDEPEPPKKGGKNASAASKKKAKADEEEEEEDGPELSEGDHSDPGGDVQEVPDSEDEPSEPEVSMARAKGKPKSKAKAKAKGKAKAKAKSAAGGKGPGKGKAKKKPGRPPKEEGDGKVVFARRRMPDTSPASLRFQAIVNVFKSDIVPKLRDADLAVSCWEEPWLNLAHRVFQNDDDFGDDLRTLEHYEAQLFPRVTRFLKLALDDMTV